MVLPEHDIQGGKDLIDDVFAKSILNDLSSILAKNQAWQQSVGSTEFDLLLNRF